MSTNNQNKPMFRNSFMGYNKADVDDYVARTESELEITENRQGKWESQIKDLNGEIERLSHTVDRERTERVEFQDKNTVLEQKIAELKKELQDLKQEKESTSEADPKTIQDAILNAQRMSEMIITEANQKAEDIRNETELYHQEQERIARQIVEDAKKEAHKIVDTATAKYESLQRDYNSALLDVTKFKSELLNMYQKHIKLLDSLPEIETPKIDYIDVEDLSGMQEKEKNV